MNHLLLSIYFPPSKSIPLQSTYFVTNFPAEGKISIKYPSGSLTKASPFMPPEFGVFVNSTPNVLNLSQAS